MTARPAHHERLLAGKYHPGRQLVDRKKAAVQRPKMQLGAQLIRLQHELSRKQDYANRLETLLRARTERIDELANTIAALREQNQRLDAEAERYFQMLAAH